MKRAMLDLGGGQTPKKGARLSRRALYPPL
jgi:hypothetical protein